MNTLSLLIYLSGVIPSIGIILSAGSVIILPCLVIIGGVWSAETEKNQFPKLKPYFITCAVALFISIMIPDQKTIYMIAASEMGEAVVTTEAGQEVFNGLKDTVMYQLQQLQGVESND
jgi:hypothetical protein